MPRQGAWPQDGQPQSQLDAEEDQCKQCSGHRHLLQLDAELSIRLSSSHRASANVNSVQPVLGPFPKGQPRINDWESSQSPLPPADYHMREPMTSHRKPKRQTHGRDHMPAASFEEPAPLLTRVLAASCVNFKSRIHQAALRAWSHHSCKANAMPSLFQHSEWSMLISH